MPYRQKDEYAKLICSHQNGQLSYEVTPSLRGITCDSIQKFYTATHEININSKVVIYPNPISDRIQIMAEESLPKSEIILRDILGRIVLKQNVDIYAQSPINVDMQDINTGIYFLTIKSGQQSAVKKIMKK